METFFHCNITMQKPNSLSVGAYTRYEGDHYGKLIWAEHGLTGPDIYYDHDALKMILIFMPNCFRNFQRTGALY